VRHGAELKVGLITLLAVALLALFTYYIGGSLGAKHTYAVFVLFDNARGLQQGDPVHMVGVKIGEVKSVKITPSPRKAEATLAIDRRFPLYYNYTFQITASGLIQERSIEVIPAPSGEEGLQLADQSKVPGTAAPDLSDLLVTGESVLTSLRHTSEQLSSVMGDKALMENVRRALESLALAADSARQLADTAVTIARQAQPQTEEMLTRLQMAAADLQSTTSAVREVLEKGTTLEDLQQTAVNIRAISRNAERFSESIAELAADPEMQRDLKATVRELHSMGATLNDVASDLKAFSSQLKEAAPSIPKVAKQAEQMATTVTELQERLKPPEMHADFHVLYSPKAGRSFSTGNVDFNYPTMSQRFLRLGVDDIGETTDFNAQIGERMRLGTIRYGLVRSRLGVGFDYRPSRRTGVSVDVFNPNSLRTDITGEVGLGNSGWSVMMGVRDLGKENLYVVGGKVTR